MMVPHLRGRITHPNYLTLFVIRMRHSRVKLLILVNKPNDLDVCIKDSEHNRRNAKKTKKKTKTFVVRKTLSSERMMHFHPVRFQYFFQE